MTSPELLEKIAIKIYETNPYDDGVEILAWENVSDKEQEHFIESALTIMFECEKYFLSLPF